MSRENLTKKLIRSKSGLRIVAMDDNYRSPFLLCEPQWMPDKEAPTCKKCCIKFGFTTRRHHCRRCGQIYCSSCCENKLELPRMSFIDPVRICHDCLPTTLEENKFFDQQIKTLTNGATFTLENTQMIFASNDVFLCRLSPDHKYLVFEGVKMVPLDIHQIKALKVDKDVINGVNSIEIEYCRTSNGETNTVKLATTSEAEQRKTGTSWIEAMQQAIKMLEDLQVDG